VTQATGRKMQYELKMRHSAEELQKSRGLELRVSLSMSSGSLESQEKFGEEFSEDDKRSSSLDVYVH